MFSQDGLTNLFAGIFLFGLIFTAASLALGFTHFGGLGGHGGGWHAHIGGHSYHVHIDGHAEGPSTQHDGLGFLNMPTVMVFLTWFGGIGYVLRTTIAPGPFISVALALAGGLAGGTIMFTVLARWLWPMMSRPLTGADYSLPGTPARVVSSIRAGGVGEIVYAKNGTRFTAGARSVDEEAVGRGAEVVIIRYEKGLAYVQDVQRMLEGVKAKVG